ncbi:MAG: hypothetical protein IPP81_12280 [Chitinophagaceae bacterium]|nr:hypothetical protein [Chitinophagaceae bacterium]
MKLKQIFFTVAISAVTALCSYLGAMELMLRTAIPMQGRRGCICPQTINMQACLMATATGSHYDFTALAQAATPAVVHIKTKTNAKQVSNNLSKKQPNNPFQRSFLMMICLTSYLATVAVVLYPSKSQWNGVIISDDGYIVTNNHVVENADEINVALEKKTYKAKVIGTDPSMIWQ